MVQSRVRRIPILGETSYVRPQVQMDLPDKPPACTGAPTLAWQSALSIKTISGLLIPGQAGSNSVSLVLARPTSVPGIGGTPDINQSFGQTTLMPLDVKVFRCRPSRRRGTYWGPASESLQRNHVILDKETT